MLLHYSLTRYVGLERTMGIGDIRTCRRVDDGILLASAVFPRSPWASAARPQLPESLFQAPARTGRSAELGGSQGRAGPDAITAFRQTIMSTELFTEGGPHKIRRTGRDAYEMSVSLPKDQDGRTGRECPRDGCSPGYFKVKGGTGIQNQPEAFCPYCRAAGKPSDFATKEQVRYAKDIVAAQAHEGIERMLKDSLGLDSRGKRQLVGGLINVSIEMKPSPKQQPWRPWEDVLKRDVVCPGCGLDHSVYGLAVWCSDCGGDIFSTHFLGEINVIRAMLADVDRRHELLGERVAAKDVENALEDLVSIFEATLKIELRRFMRSQGISDSEVDAKMRRIGSRMQSVANAEAIVPEHCNGTQLFAQADVLRQLGNVFDKRHPITHSLGVIDRKYLERARSGEIEGREVRVEKREVEQSAQSVFLLLEDLHLRLFPDSLKAACLSPLSGG